ncbi:MAG: bifunctional phosphoglucose/phosphomannose isomerase [Anaerolineae bacterium]|nr:bifunctional phosphoglucose/phosphomannose isomerase [Anaerolineae bacterium]
MTSLDDVRALDAGNMLRLVSELPAQLRAGWRNAATAEFPPEYRYAQRILILGMGGSAIGGDLLRGLITSRCPVPIVVNRDYGIPAWASDALGGTLVIASSHSGNTEETLTALAAARSAGAFLVALTTGGELAARAQAWGVPLVLYQYDSPPRGALGYSFSSLLAVLSRLGFILDPQTELEEAAATLEKMHPDLAEERPLSSNLAKQLAARLVGRMPVIIGSGVLATVARRWKCQFNENSKTWAIWEELPEADHNLIVGTSLPAGGLKQLTALFLAEPEEDTRVALRRQATADILAEAGIACETVTAQGQSLLARMFSLIFLGDYVSWYLALAQDVDPTPVEPITRLKALLAAAG